MMNRPRDVDKLLIIVVGLLLLIGTVVVYSASAMFADSRYGSDTFFFQRQLIWLGLSVAALFIAMRVNYRALCKLAWPLLIISMVLLVVVLFTREINGAKRWISFGFFGFQPSEVFKFSLIIFLAAMLAAKREKITQISSVIFPLLPVIMVGFGLILLQPNLGTVLVLASSTFILLFIAGVRKRLLAILVGGMASVSFLMVYVIGYKRARVDTYLESVSDPLLASYQVKQSILAIGSGGLFGKGLGQGSAKLFYLPAPHTDFVFATLAEEGGFIVATLVLILIGILVWRGVKIAIHSPDLPGFYLAIGITLVVFCQAMTNLMVATAMIPATGLPLPFLSYGGSSMLITCAAIGILLNISRYAVETPQLFKSRIG
ncbi:MAG: putative lipid II flippase FtsW [bacterium]|nr:putative lipid II flippase FtsW [bacterium]